MRAGANHYVFRVCIIHSPRQLITLYDWCWLCWVCWECVRFATCGRTTHDSKLTSAGDFEMSAWHREVRRHESLESFSGFSDFSRYVFRVERESLRCRWSVTVGFAANRWRITQRSIAGCCYFLNKVTVSVTSECNCFWHKGAVLALITIFDCALTTAKHAVTLSNY